MNKQNGLALQNIITNIDNNSFDIEKICLAAVNENGLALKYIENQTKELCLVAVNENGLALKYVKQQTNELCLAAVNENDLASKYVKNKINKIHNAASLFYQNIFY